MTREELSQMVELLRDTAKLHQPNEEILTDVKAESFIFVMDSVLSALSESAENKGDLISRQAVLDELEKWDWQELYLPIHFKQILDDVPSVENKGEWEKIWRTDCGRSEYVCSKCGCGEDYVTDFCPNCGADMRGDKAK